MLTVASVSVKHKSMSDKPQKDIVNQAMYDLQMRHLMIETNREFPDEPILYPSVAMRSFLRHAIERFERGEDSCGKLIDDIKSFVDCDEIE